VIVLPSSAGGRSTETTGFFECSASEFSQWLRGALGDDWHLRNTTFSSLDDLAVFLCGTTVDRYAVVPMDGWCALLSNGPGGTDVGMLPSLAARKLGARGVRAVASGGKYPATMLEVYEPDCREDVLRCRRTIYAVNDGGPWRFGESGDRWSFESAEAFLQPRIRDRFTPQLLRDYLRNLGIPNELPSTLPLISVVIRGELMDPRNGA
jgi:hypothetical protein